MGFLLRTIIGPHIISVINAHVDIHQKMKTSKPDKIIAHNMYTSMLKRIIIATAAVFTLSLTSCLSLSAYALSTMETAHRSVVKIYVTYQREDYTLPWQGVHPSFGTGTGFIINKRRILTNAHIVSDARSIELQKNGNARKYQAKIVFIAHDCDLAMLDVEDPSFFEETQAMKLANVLPDLNDEVTVLGYPMGGQRLSVTKGVVSRIDYSVYSHSYVDQHLVLQVDAAINPGNSGGPVMFKGKVVGLAFQGMMMGENIGYAIPVPVIQHFLTDINDGSYNGYPELGVMFMDTQNDALRKNLKIPDEKTGIIVSYIDPFASAVNNLRLKDVLLSVDNVPIANDGSVCLDNKLMIFSELVERKQWGESVTFQVWRDGAEITVAVPLTNPADPFIYRYIYDERPLYYIIGGLTFCPLSRGYLNTLGNDFADSNKLLLWYYSEYAKIDSLYEDFEQFIVLTRRLPHPVNTYADKFVNGIVTNINNTPIRSIRDIERALEHPTNGFHVMRFAGIDDSLVMDSSASSSANNEILIRYGIPSPHNIGEDE